MGNDVKEKKKWKKERKELNNWITRRRGEVTTKIKTAPLEGIVLCSRYFFPPLLWFLFLFFRSTGARVRPLMVRSCARITGTEPIRIERVRRSKLKNLMAYRERLTRGISVLRNSSAARNAFPRICRFPVARNMARKTGGGGRKAVIARNWEKKER